MFKLALQHARGASVRSVIASALLVFGFLGGGASAWAAADVNKAALEELRTVKGIGPSIAGRILDERKKGNFKDWVDFIGRVKGIGDGNAAKFSANGLTVNGAAYTGGSTVAVAAPAAPNAKPMKP